MIAFVARLITLTEKRETVSCRMGING